MSSAARAARSTSSAPGTSTPSAAALIDAGRSYGMPYLDDMNVPEPEGVGPMNQNVRDGTAVQPLRASTCGR